MGTRVQYVYDCDCCKKKNIKSHKSFTFHVGWSYGPYGYGYEKDTVDIDACSACAKKIEAIDRKSLDLKQTQTLVDNIRVWGLVSAEVKER